ncbi:pupal cuticle protein C1B [Tribolium castaneum]|uniref:Pupal cuticle protein C1B-like Protein n=1 Tax=Tribolium castaneum TaxID=7070 RepID=D6WVQ5_TRICA|nr:PREDICTED: pupal cuticle protein C1B [Tribolium castaneum]EFA08603.1 Pupal cuticle protein C1B-like Protein [Tribolium castaneum]|eukprot:XP_015837980.1 PREDICTED: pupal cuticle protein C1B [Tribolium castaneum]
MAFKLVILAAAFVCANAGLLPAAAPAVAYSAAPAVSHVSYASPAVSYAAPAITSQHSNTFRSFANLGQVSTYSKTIDTPFSSVSKADVRVSNPGFQYAAPVAHAAAPAIGVAYSAAPVAHAAAPAIGVAYSAAPAVSHVTYSGLGFSYGW